MLSKEKALYQVKLILDYLPEEEYKLIPTETIDYIEENFEYDENISINNNIPLENQNIDEKTFEILDKIVKKIELDKKENDNKKVKGYINEIKKSNESYNVKMENIRLKNIIETLEKENSKIPKAKKLLEDYQKLIGQKNNKISNLINVNNGLKENINKIPKILRKIFI